MAKLIIALFMALCLIAVASAAKTAKLTGTFTGETADLKSCYDIITTLGYGTENCHSTTSGSSWNPSNPAEFGTKVTATMAFEGEDCDAKTLESHAYVALGEACPKVTLKITKASSAASASTISAVVAAGVVAAAAVGSIAF